MANIRGEGSVKRFGARYGRKVKAKLQQIECEQKKQNKCPYCLYKKIKRLSKGIYVCEKCNNKFTGRAYNIAKEIRIKEEVKAGEAPEEQKAPEEEEYSEQEETQEEPQEEPQEETEEEPKQASAESSEGFQDSDEFGEESK